MPTIIRASGARWSRATGSRTTPTWCFRQRIAASLGVGAHVVDVEDAGDGLLFEPFLGVARGDAGAVGEFGHRAAGPLVQGRVQAEPGAQVDPEQLQGAGGRVQDALLEGGSVVVMGGPSDRWVAVTPRRGRSGPPDGRPDLPQVEVTTHPPPEGRPP